MHAKMIQYLHTTIAEKEALKRVQGDQMDRFFFNV